MATKKKQENGGFAVTIIFILSIVVLILIFVLFTRDQGNKAVEKTLTDLAQTNQQLQKEQRGEKEKSIRDRLTEAGFDPGRMWIVEESCEFPYCLFTTFMNGEGDAQNVVGLERWSGYFGKYKDETSSCDAFVVDDARALPIRTDHLADVERNLLKASQKNDPIEITVFRVVPDESGIPPCDRASYVMNVHLK